MATSRNKILVQLWDTRIDAFNRQTEELGLRRDLYLSRLIEREIEKLAAELPFGNTLEAKKFISGKLDLLSRKSVSIAIDAGAAERLREICDAKNLVRDSFFNRIIFFLSSNWTALLPLL